MKYLCLGYLDRVEMDSRPKTEIDAIMAECWPHMETLYKTDSVVVDAGLHTPTKILRRRSGKLLVTDGPFAETKEILGGAFILEAKDIDDAIRLAALHPTTQVAAGEGLGWRLEIHPAHYFKDAAGVQNG